MITNKLYIMWELFQGFVSIIFWISFVFACLVALSLIGGSGEEEENTYNY